MVKLMLSPSIACIFHGYFADPILCKYWKILSNEVNFMIHNTSGNAKHNAKL